MPKNRLVVDSAGLPTISRQPAARVIDTYSAEAARARGADLAAFAGALGQVAPKLQGLAVQLQEQKRTAGITRGKARLAELIQEQADFGAAVRQGLIEAKDSPFFRAGILEAAGIVAGDRYGDLLRTQMGEIADPTDLSAFDAMQTKVYNEVAEQFGPEEGSKLFQAAFQNRALGHTASLRAAFANGVSPALLEKRRALLYEEASSVINVARTEGYSKEQLGAALTAVIDTAFAQGLRGQLVNETVTSAFVAAAIDMAEEGDSFAAKRLIEASEYVMTGPKGEKRAALFLSEKGQAALVKAKNDVSAIEQNKYRFDAFRQAEDRRQAADGLMAGAMDLFAAASDVDSVDLEPLIQQARALRQPGLVNDLRNLQESFRGARWYTDVEMMAQAEIDIWRPNSTFGMQDVARMVANRNLSEPDSRILRSQITQRDNALSAGQAGPLSDPTFNQFGAGWFSRQFKDKWGFQGGELGKATDTAIGDFRQEFLKKWESGEYQQMSHTERSAFLQEVAQRAVDVRGGGMDLITSISEKGSQAPYAFHDPRADWKTTLVLSRGETLRISTLRGKPVADILNGLTDADAEVIAMYVPLTKEYIDEFIASQVRLLGTESDETQPQE